MSCRRWVRSLNGFGSPGGTRKHALDTALKAKLQANRLVFGGKVKLWCALADPSSVEGQARSNQLLGFCCTDHSRDAESLVRQDGLIKQAWGVEYGIDKRTTPEPYLLSMCKKGAQRRSSCVDPEVVEYPVVQRRGELDTQAQPG